MMRYINAESLIKILNAKAEMALGTPKQVFFSAANMVEKLPAADVQEVKHGRWLTDRFGFERAICSICQAVFEGGDSWKYCPHCGAKMDGGDEE